MCVWGGEGGVSFNSEADQPIWVKLRNITILSKIINISYEILDFCAKFFLSVLQSDRLLRLVLIKR